MFYQRLGFIIGFLVVFFLFFTGCVEISSRGHVWGSICFVGLGFRV